jgi:hypothetical protein
MVPQILDQTLSELCNPNITNDDQIGCFVPAMEIGLSIPKMDAPKKRYLLRARLSNPKGN